MEGGPDKSGLRSAQQRPQVSGVGGKGAGWLLRMTTSPPPFQCGVACGKLVTTLRADASAIGFAGKSGPKIKAGLGVWEHVDGN